MSQRIQAVSQIWNTAPHCPSLDIQCITAKDCCIDIVPMGSQAHRMNFPTTSLVGIWRDWKSFSKRHPRNWHRHQMSDSKPESNFLSERRNVTI
ncbi:hypothetical protein I7I51_00990 [Histoplasma capsulatum]|uniref:Uncharacterized protein n=1 Tax=Ajellomyces capsulatus TaxID=5037 RepID=A0A8A1MDB2_AJECA|nr:hypothetical protein I7I51_00990 [Histoplasma capsulatum]